MDSDQRMSVDGFGQIHRKIMHAIVAAGGQISGDKIKELYEGKGDSQRFSYLMRRGVLEWVRNRSGKGIAARITEQGRGYFESDHGEAT